MKRILISLITVGSIFAQTGTTAKPTQLPYVMQTLPGPIPTSMTAVMKTCTANQQPTTGCLPLGKDIYVCYVDLVGTGQTITIQDGQATPISWIAAPLGSAGTPTSWMFVANDDARCRWMPGGVSWQASATGATGYFTIKHN
jgi:hypothetical protein